MIDLRPALANALSLNSGNLFERPEDLFNKQIPAIFIISALNDFKFKCADLSNGFSEFSIHNIVKTDLGKEVVAQCYHLAPSMIVDKLQNVLLDMHFPYDKNWDFNTVLRFAKLAEVELNKKETKPRSYLLLKAALERLQGDSFSQQVLVVKEEIFGAKAPENRKAAILLLKLLIEKDPYAPVIRRLFIDDFYRDAWQPFYSAVLSSEDPILKDQGPGLKDFWLNALAENLKRLPKPPGPENKDMFSQISEFFSRLATGVFKGF